MSGPAVSDYVAKAARGEHAAETIALQRTRIAALEAALATADEKIGGIHAAFGAPGDYGYGTREGDALFGLYRCQAELRAIRAAAQHQAHEGHEDG